MSCNVQDEATKRVSLGVETCFVGKDSRVREISALAENVCSGR